MHELPVTQSILNIALTESEKYHAKRVTKIKISIGVMAGMMPECIQEYFNIISEGTIAEKAELIFQIVPATFECQDCGAVFSSNRIRFRCESCNSNRVKLLGGKEFLVDSIDIED